VSRNARARRKFGSGIRKGAANLNVLPPKINKEPSTLYHQFITDLTKTRSHEAFHIITVYKGVHSPSHATAALKQSSPRLFNTIIDANWRRNKVVGSFQMFAFLDDPGSRYRSSNVSLPIASAQDGYHHHSILIVDHWISERIKHRFCHSDADSHAIDPEWSTVRQRIVKQARDGAPSKLSPHSFARKYLGATWVQSCMIQHLPTSADLERAARYASKSAKRLSQLFPDDYLHILPQGVVTPAEPISANVL